MSKPENNEAFVRAFQERAGLGVDGWAGPDTRKALDRLLPPKTAPAGKALDARSEQRLQGVDDRLVRVVRRAAEISTVPFIVVEGLRTKARQEELYAQGRTKPGPKVTWTLKSKHIDGLAVDLAPTLSTGAIDWNDLAKFDAIYRAMMAAAVEHGVSLRSGMDWDRDGRLREKGETDSPHFELR